jgi:hypothetical protein
MSALTQQQEAAIREWLAKHPTLSVGVGTAESACSVAAINAALTGDVTAHVPHCMSAVIGQFIGHVQDAMPELLRNGQAWKSLLPLAAGTGRTHESERVAVLLDWIFGEVLPMLYRIARDSRIQSEWWRMTTERSISAIADAHDAALSVLSRHEAKYTMLARARSAADRRLAMNMIDEQGYADAHFLSCLAAMAMGAVVHANTDPRQSTVYVASIATRIGNDDIIAWDFINPVRVLQQLVAVTNARAMEIT